jgi:DNA-binding IclR family transcriptional regulator
MFRHMEDVSFAPSARGAVQRAFAVLEAVVAGAPRCSLASVAAYAGLPKSTTRRLLQILIDLGYVQQLAEGVYGPGSQILTLAGQVGERLDYGTLALPAMRRLQLVLPETVHFALLDGDHALYVEKLEGQGTFRMASRIGATIGLHCTAIGKSMLAFLGPDDVSERLGLEPFARQTPRTIVTRAELDRELVLVRKRGYAIDDGENEQHVRCVAAAVFDHQRRVVGGLSLSCPAFVLTLDDAMAVGPSVVGAAAAASLALGAQVTRLPAPYSNTVTTDANTAWSRAHKSFATTVVPPSEVAIGEVGPKV